MLRRRVLLVMIAGIPLIFLRQMFDPINVPKLSLLIVGTAIVGTLRVAELLQGASTATFKKAWIPAVALVAPLLIAWLFSPYRWWALFGQYPRFTGLIPYLFVVLFGLLVMDAFAGDARPVAWATTVAGGVAGLYALIQFAGLDPFEWSVRGVESNVVASTLGNPNFAGAFLAIASCVGLSLFLTERNRKLLAGVLTGIAFAGCLIARSEGAYAAALAGGVIVAGFWLSDRFRWSRVAALAVAGLIAIAAVGSVLVSIVGGGETPLPATIERRGDWWKAAASMSIDNPVVGRGPGSFSIEHSRYRTLDDAIEVGSDITDDPHSVFLSFLTGAGALGAAGFVVAIVWILRRERALDPADLIGAGLFAGFVAYLIQALISIDTVALRVAAWTCIGGMLASQFERERVPTGKQSKTKRQRQAPLQHVPALAVTALVGGALVIGGLWFAAADKNFKDAIAALAGGDVNTAVTEADKAIGFRNEYAYRRGYGSQVGGFAVSLAEDGEEEPANILLEEARSAFRYVYDFPHANAIADWASILSGVTPIDDGAGEEALELYERAVGLDPLNGTLRDDAAATAIEIGRFDTAIALLEDYPALDENAALLGRLALAYANAGEEDKARDAIDKAFSLQAGQSEARDAEELLDRS